MPVSSRLPVLTLRGERSPITVPATLAATNVARAGLDSNGTQPPQPAALSEKHRSVKAIRPGARSQRGTSSPAIAQSLANPSLAPQRP